MKSKVSAGGFGTRLYSLTKGFPANFKKVVKDTEEPLSSIPSLKNKWELDYRGYFA